MDIAAMQAIAADWQAACASFDTDRIVGLLADDALVWFNFERVEHDRAGYRAMLERGGQVLADRRYEEVRIHLHPGGFVEQATLVGHTADGETRVPFLLVATVRDGRISRLEEYLDGSLMQARAA